MITVYPFENLGLTKFDWLTSRHHFSFGDYHNKERMGFGMHPHADMEIITYVRAGAISHKDSLGNAGITKAGEVQVMSAGTGITHAEMNNEAEPCVLFQIWILPNERGMAPRWETFPFPKSSTKGQLTLLVSGRPEDKDKKALRIYQDAAIYMGTLAKGEKITQGIKYKAYVLASRGMLRVEGEEMKPGDGAEVMGVSAVEIEALTDAEVLMIDVPK